jgi:chromosome segregation ATPase
MIVFCGSQEEHEKSMRTMTERATVAESQLEEAKAAAKLKQTEHAKRIKELQAKVSGEQAQSAVVAELTSTLTETTARADAQSKEIAALQTELKSMKTTAAAASKKANAVEKQLREELSAAQSAVEEQQKLVQQGQQKLQSARGHVEAAAQAAGRALAASERRAAAIRELNGAVASSDSINVAEVALPPARRKRSAIETKQPETDELVGEVTQV